MAADEPNDGTFGERGKRVMQTSASSSDDDSVKSADSSVEEQSPDNANEGSSSAVQDRAASNEEPVLTERQRSKMPVPSTADKRASRKQNLKVVVCPEKLAEDNKQRNRARAKDWSQSAGFKTAIRGDGAPCRRKSFVEELKSLKRLGRSEMPGPQVAYPEQTVSLPRQILRRFTAPSVYFEKEVRVKKVDCSPGGDPPAALPQTPVIEEDLREAGVILDEAERQAIKIEKDQRAYAADFDRRMTNSRRSSAGESSSQGQSSKLIAAIDELDRLHFSCGRSPTELERGASVQDEPVFGNSSTDQGTVNSPHPRHRASTDRDTPVDQTGLASRRSSTSQANSSLSAQDGDAIQESSTNQENIPSSTQVGTPTEAPSDSDRHDHPINPRDRTKVADDETTSNYIVRAQVGIIYDQDPSIAIQSLSCYTPGLPNIFVSGKIAVKTARVGTLEDTPLDQSQQDKQHAQQHAESSDAIPQRYPGQHGIFSFRFLAYCLDLFGSELHPMMSDGASSSETQNPTAHPKDSHEDQVKGSSSVAHDTVDEDESSCNSNSSVQEAAKTKSNSDVPKNDCPAPISAAPDRNKKRLGGYCHDSEPIARPFLEVQESDTCDGSSPSSHGRDAFPILSEPHAPTWHQHTLSSCDVEPGPSSAHDDFGTTLEKAYIYSCSTHTTCAGLAALMPPNAACRSSNQPIKCHRFSSSCTAKTLDPTRKTDHEIETNLLRVKSWLNPPVKNPPATDLDMKSSISSRKRRTLLKRTSHGMPSCSSGVATPADLTSLCRTLNGSRDDSIATSDETLLCVLPFYGEPDFNNYFNLPPHVSKRAMPTCRAPSQCSVITAFRDAQLLPHEASKHFPSNFTNGEDSFIQDYDRSDRGCNVPDKPATQSSIHSPNAHSESPGSVSLKRSSSGSTASSALSIITTFTSFSKASAVSETSIHSGSSSGSSGGSSLRFGRNGNSPRWTPWNAKSPAIVCVDKDIEGFKTDSSNPTANNPPMKHSRRLAPSSETMRKFVMKYPTTQPDCFGRNVAKKLEMRRVVQNATPTGYSWNPWHDGEEIPDEEVVRYKVFRVPEEEEEQPCSSVLDAAEISATECGDASLSPEGSSHGDGR